MTLFEYCPVKFIEIIKIFFRKNPCILCGLIHPVRIHQVRLRIFCRFNKDGKPECGLVVRIICGNAKKAGTQYTVTILPHFLLPGCQVRADNLYEAATNPEKRRHIDSVLTTIQADDERTGYKHLNRFTSCIKDSIKIMADYIIKLGGSLPEMMPVETDPPERTHILFHSYANAYISEITKLFGGTYPDRFQVMASISFFIHKSYPISTFPVILSPAAIAKHSKKTHPPPRYALKA